MAKKIDKINWAKKVKLRELAIPVINKLTAEEVNELVDKENEIIDTVNEMLEGFKEITDEEIVSIAKNNINQLFNIVIHTSGNKSIDGLAMPDLYLPIKYIRRAYSTNPSDNIYITFEYSEGSDDGDATQWDTFYIFRGTISQKYNEVSMSYSAKNLDYDNDNVKYTNKYIGKPVNYKFYIRT